MQSIIAWKLNSDMFWYEFIINSKTNKYKFSCTCVRVHQAAPEEGEVLYEESVFYFDDTRKWRERYVVVRANYCLECHERLEVSLWKWCRQIKGIYIRGPSYSFCVFFLQTFVKGVPPFHKLLPTGGKVLTAEEAYMAVVDKCFPDESCE